jgi:hypothetical protein
MPGSWVEVDGLEGGLSHLVKGYVNRHGKATNAAVCGDERHGDALDHAKLGEIDYVRKGIRTKALTNVRRGL